MVKNGLCSVIYLISMQDLSHTILFPYQDSWAEKFDQEKKRLLEVFGDKAVAIEHIGSTSIPGLSSKPIIDIAVLVERADEADGFIESLEGLGYQFDKPSSSTERHLFRKGDPTEFHLSIAYKDRGGFWERQILFRDYLRKHDDIRDEYARLKTVLIENDPTGKGSYIAGKSGFVNKVLDLARKEK